MILIKNNLLPVSLIKKLTPAKKFSEAVERVEKYVETVPKYAYVNWGFEKATGIFSVYDSLNYMAEFKI